MLHPAGLASPRPACNNHTCPIGPKAHACRLLKYDEVPHPVQGPSPLPRVYVPNDIHLCGLRPHFSVPTLPKDIHLCGHYIASHVPFKKSLLATRTLPPSTTSLLSRAVRCGYQTHGMQRGFLPHLQPVLPPTSPRHISPCRASHKPLSAAPPSLNLDWSPPSPYSIHSVCPAPFKRKSDCEPHACKSNLQL